MINLYYKKYYFAVISNFYSYKLLKDYIQKKNIKKFIIVNIGYKKIDKTIYVRGIFKSLIFIKKFNKLIKKRNIYFEELILPNKNNIVCNYFYSSLDKNISKLSLISEGSLNYISRNNNIIEIFQKIIRKLISITFFINYHIFIGDNQSFAAKNNGFSIITRFKTGLKTDAKKIIEIPFRKVNNRIEKNTLIIIGSPYFDYFKINLNKVNINKICQYLSNKSLRVYYLPHSKGKKSSIIEKKYLYSKLNINKIILNRTAEDFIYEINPEFIVSFGGSSALFNFIGSNSKILAFGFDALVEKNSKIFSELKNLYANLGVKII